LKLFHMSRVANIVCAWSLLVGTYGFQQGSTFALSHDIMKMEEDDGAERLFQPLYQVCPFAKEVSNCREKNFLIGNWNMTNTFIDISQPAQDWTISTVIITPPFSACPTFKVNQTRYEELARRRPAFDGSRNCTNEHGITSIGSLNTLGKVNINATSEGAIDLLFISGENKQVVRAIQSSGFAIRTVICADSTETKEALIEKYLTKPAC